MTSPTVIRHRETKEGFIQVISMISDIYVQEYEVKNGRTVLNVSWVFGSEEKAIQCYDRAVNAATFK